MTIETVHLQLVPYAPKHLLALIEGYERFEESFGWPAADGLRAFILSDDVSPEWLARLGASSLADPWVHGFAVVDRDSRSVIGSVGFKGPPDQSGVAEIAYGIVPAFQGRGYVTEAAAAGVGFAFENGVRRVRAHTRPNANASTRVLQKCGFEYAGEVDDPEDGLVWRWERGLAQAGPDGAGSS
ncbi:MAG: GNAT family N-acetyltransferase [Gemmatimonadaceae bacterium]